MEKEKRVVLITGASRGIGAATAMLFAKKDYDIVINYKENELLANIIKKEIEEQYDSRVLIYQADISNEEEIDNMIAKIASTFGKVDVLVNNAAIAIDTAVGDKTKENFLKILEVNLVGSFLVSKKVEPIMKFQNNASIIFISSANGIDTNYPESLDYDASKAGVISLMKNLSIAYAPYIRVNAIAPGWIKTDMSKDLDIDFFKEQLKPISLNRFGNPEEIASVVAFLASDEASYINGTTIRVDGGYHY